MTPERLRDLIAGGENLNVEFKGEERKPFSDHDLIEAVVCLANRQTSEPGWLLIGVEDNGAVTGCRMTREGGTTEPVRVQAVIANNTRPSLATRACIVEYEGKPILAIEVPPSRQPVGTADGRYLRRALGGRGKPECIPFYYHEMQAQQASRGMLDYTAMTVSEADWEDLDPLEFERFRRTIRESGGRGDSVLLDLPDLELAKALGAVIMDHDQMLIRVLGLLLFGKVEALQKFLPTHEAAFQQISGTKVEVNEFFHYPLVRLMDELLGLFRARYREEELILGLLRIGIPDYPERAFRECVANALVHRDYTRLGAVHVQWYKDRLEISNPGGFPEGVRLDNLLVTPPVPRNPLLADAFKRAGLVERTGRGIDTIFFEQLRNGRPAPNYERSTETGVTVILPGGEANTDFVCMVAVEGQAGRPLGLEALLIMNALWLEREIDTTHAARLIQRHETEARSILARLVETGLVEQRGERKGRMYHLSSATYRKLGDKAAYVRQRGFEAIQQRQMILQFVDKHGSISRSEAASLCRINSTQAYRLLQ
ncbi:MAG: ATP-binding protein, partial [Bacteroidota bacterium]